jgi:hypothetical protein
MPNKRWIEALKLLQLNDPAEIRLDYVEELAAKDPANRQSYFDAYIYLRDEPHLKEIPTPEEIEIQRNLLVSKALFLNPPRPPEASGPLA